MEKRIVLDLDYCIGCRSCESACKIAFKGESRIKHGAVGVVASLPFACRHCKDALCLKSCPVEAINRIEESGRIVRSSFRCIGCSSCIYACPFGVIDKNLIQHISQKCNECLDRAEGPRCVSACSTGALKYLTIEEIEKFSVGVRVISRSLFWRRR
ncbi:MAG: 4Fe-4S dicluster domain-containing protein [candidate division WOR-3 bacterium]